MTRNTFPSAWRKPQKASAGSHVFDILNYLFFGIFTLLCIYPFYYIFNNDINEVTFEGTKEEVEREMKFLGFRKVF